MIALTLCLIPLAGSAGEGESGIDVIDVSGPLDASALEFMSSSIDAAAERGRVLALLQVNSPAVLDGEALDELLGKVENPPLPLAVWAGPAPAVVGGGAWWILYQSEHAAMAPGSHLGLLSPRVAGAPDGTIGFDGPIPAEQTEFELQPSLRQYLQDLDGETFQTVDGPVTVETLVPFEDGVTLKEVTFRQPGLGTRFFRLAATPEAAFFFLVVGLTVASFEFFAIGPGVAAGVASLSLLLAGWGIVTLPIKPWALALAILGWALLTVAYQRGGVLVLTLLGAAMLQVAGSFYIDGSAQIDPRWYLVLPSVIAVLFFFLLAMPTVQRARFSTRTIGRGGLIGEHGVALEQFDPDGVVEVRGARWRATAHREAGLSAGSEILVSGVDGMFLEVEPVTRPAKTDL